MPIVIKDNALTDSNHQLMSRDDADINRRHCIVPLQTYLAHLPALREREDVGVWLDADEIVEDLVAGGHLPQLIALNFPTFADGRAYSNAALLRTRHHYLGELRAVGDVRRDQLEQMMRCGFNAFALAEDQDANAALAGLKRFSENYQADIDRSEPLFRRRQG